MMDTKDIEDLKAQMESDLEGWSHSGESPLKKNLQGMVDLLGDVKGEMEKELAKKVKILNKMIKANAAHNPRYRVKKNVN